MIGRFRLVLLSALLLATATPGLAQTTPAAAAATRRPLLVTVDDLPVAGSAGGADDARRMSTTNQLLAALKQHGIHAVAFVIAGNVRTGRDRAILQRWLDEGHELGSHTNTHADLTALTAEAYLADVSAAHATLTAFLQPKGRTLRWFRYPYLNEGDTREKAEAVRRWLAEHGQRTVPVTLDLSDWAFDEPWAKAAASGDPEAMDLARQSYLAAIRTTVTNSEERSDAVLKRQAPQVILLHANSVGAANWDRLFTWLERTHRFATADEVMADETFRELPLDVARYGYGHYDRVARLQRLEAATTAVKAVLEAQVSAWNRGDFEAFTSGYAADATYVSPNGLTRGRAAVLARYTARYPDAASRGTLSFEIVEVRPFDGLEPDPFGGIAPGRIDSVSLLARWRLTYTGKPEASGLTLLVFRPRPRSAGGPAWEIVQDASM
jgi:peptidoglycan/xylan/chitin deacetylase (PgdA/CDA1 family)